MAGGANQNSKTGAFSKDGIEGVPQSKIGVIPSPATVASARIARVA
jgi:hypothetical protein